MSSPGARRPRVGILTSVHRPFDTRIFQKQARTLADSGYEVVLVAPHTIDVTRDGVQIRHLQPPRSRLVRLFTSGVRVLYRALGIRADVYHLHDPELIPIGVALKLLGYRVIYDAHEDVPRDLIARIGLPPRMAHALVRAVDIIEKFCASFYDAVIVARDDIAPSFARACIPTVISNYPIRSLFAPSDRGDRRRETLRVVYVGGISKRRGLTEIVQAMERVGGPGRAELHLFGPISPPTYAEELRALPGFRWTRYQGSVEYDRIPAVLADADIGVVCFLPDPNNINAGPTKLFEYMAAGLPIVASHFPLWKLIVEGNKSGVCVDPTQPAAIAAGLDYLMITPSERREMGANGRAAVAARYNWEAEGQKLIELYASVLAK